MWDLHQAQIIGENVTGNYWGERSEWVCINHKQRVKSLNLIVLLPSLFLRELRLDEVSVGA